VAIQKVTGYQLEVENGKYCPVLINEWSGLMIAEGRQKGRLKQIQRLAMRGTEKRGRGAAGPTCHFDYHISEFAD
jgi:hypothetical protein